MDKRRKGLIALLLAALCLLSLGGGLAEAGKSPYTPVRLYMDGYLTGRAYSNNGQIYLSAQDVCAYLGLDAEIICETPQGKVTMMAPGLELTIEREQRYVAVNGRYLYNPMDILYVNNKVYVPMDVLAAVFNLIIYLPGEENRVDLDVSQAQILTGGPNYYDEVYGEDNVFWLSKIISAEAYNQSMAGKIAVGNVVLNRVAHPKFPDTIFDVIFDTNNGIQFEPVLNKSIYLEPSVPSRIAACLCLEGYNTAGDSIFFVAPSLADDTWFREHRTYVVTIGTHVFYK